MTTIEPATLSDVDALVDAWLDLAREQRDHGSHLPAAANREAVRESFGTHVMSRGVLVARDGAALVGFVMFGFETGGFETNPDRGVVRNVWVRPERRDEGLGSTLLERAEAELAERGADVVTLEVLATNEAARRFYEHRGYEPHRVQYAKPVDGGSESDTHTN